MNEHSIRCFFAIAIPQSLRQSFASLEEHIKKQFSEDTKPAIRWLEFNHLHLTLRFIGEADPQQVKNLIMHAQQITQQYTAFNIEFVSVELFPSPHKPQVIALTTSHNPLLTAIASSLEQVAVNNGFTSELRTYRPHLTLARIKLMHTKIAQLPALTDFFPISMQVEDVVLYQSILSSETVEYRAIKNFRLLDSE